MITSSPTKAIPHLLTALAAFALACASLRANVVFSDDFSGSGADLNGATPDVTSGGATWVAAPIINQNGTFDPDVGNQAGDSGSATLAFSPVHGSVYTLDLSVTTSGDTDWIALGFAKGQASLAGTNRRFITGDVVGLVWMLARGSDNAGVNPNRAFRGDGTVSPNGGTADGLDWAGGMTVGGPIDLRIVLDTTGGPGAWTATWYAKPPTDRSYTRVRPTTVLLDESISSVGFAKSGTGIATSTVTSFSLTSTVLPNPDTDEDGLADEWEILHFRSSPAESDATILAKYDGVDDPDADTFDNEAEETAGTDPTDAGDFPPVSFLPVSDGNPSTSEHGYAGSKVNAVSFCRDNLQTVGNQQFIAYYRRHATDPSHPDNNTIAIGRRKLDETRWEIFTTPFQAVNIDDAHDVVSFAIDGDGFLHLSWGMHVNSLRYAKSTASVRGLNPVQMVSLGTAGMTGQENSVTYPMFQTLPNGNVLFMFREGGSGNGDTYLNRYNIATDTWTPVHTNGSGLPIPLFKGTGFSPNYNLYPDRISLADDGTIHVAGVVRYNSDSQTTPKQSGYQTNHRYLYMRSADDGATWTRSDGSRIDLPMTEKDEGLPGFGPNNVPEIIEDIPEGYSLMNQSGMTTDRAGRPVIANWWSPDTGSGDFTRNYQVFYHDGTRWQRRQISARNIEDPGFQVPESELRNMSRPVVVVDEDDRIIVLYRDDRESNGVTVVFSEPLAQDPDRLNWSRLDLTTENLGDWEPTYDEGRWKRDGVLQLLYQRCPGQGQDYTSQNKATPVLVLEWNVRAYFNRPIRWIFDTEASPGKATIRALSRIGFRFDLRTATDLLFTNPPASSLPGDGTWLDFGNWMMNEPRRFWLLERVEEATNDL